MIGKAIYSLLRGNTALNNVQISPLITAQELSMPAITYMVDDVVPSDTKNGVSRLDEVSFTIIIFDKDYAAIETYQKETRDTLDRYCGLVQGLYIQSIQFGSYSDQYDRSAEMYGRTLTFTARLDPQYIIPTDYSPLDYSPLDYSLAV